MAGKLIPMAKQVRAFTRMEMVATIAAIALLALVAHPIVASSPSTPARAVCANNLRLIGRAVAEWSGNQNEKVPWRTRVAEGGTMASGKLGLAWLEYAFLSNELVTPKILACPGDEGVRVADTFPRFAQSGFRANALSYTIGLDPAPEAGRAWISGDRNLRTSGINACSSGVNAADIFIRLDPGVGWTNGAVHGESGHVLLKDGRVEFTSGPRFRVLVNDPQFDDSGSVHFLRAR